MQMLQASARQCICTTFVYSGSSRQHHKTEGGKVTVYQSVIDIPYCASATNVNIISNHTSTLCTESGPRPKMGNGAY